MLGFKRVRSPAPLPRSARPLAHSLLHPTPPHSTTLHSTTLRCTPLHSTSPRSTRPHSTPRHSQEMIAHEEFARLGTPGYIDGLGAGMVIGLAPVLQFGPEWMKEKIGREVLNGGATLMSL